MSVLRKELVKLKQVAGNLIANTMDVETNFDSEGEALTIIVKEIDKAGILLADIGEILHDRLEKIERNNDGAVSGL